MSSEMSRGMQWTLLCGAIVVSFALQLALSPDISIRGARPNLGLCTLLTACLFVGSNTGAAMGFGLGLLEASWVAIDVGSFVVSRTIAGFAVGILEERIFRDNAPVAIVTVVVGTLAAEGCFFLVAPQPHASQWARRVLAESLYNGVLAAPLYFFVRRLIRAHA